jgi:20S proteasome subunit beta 1
MAVQFDGGVVLGADSRTSTGSYVANRVSDKIVPIHDYVWSCRSGSAADTQAVADYVKYYVDSHRLILLMTSVTFSGFLKLTWNRTLNCFFVLLVRTTCSLFLLFSAPNNDLILNLFLIISIELGRLPKVKTCANLMRKICYNNKDRMQAGLICGGWDPYEGGQIYEIPLGASS